MKVKILKNTVADKKPIKAGQFAELSEKEAKFLVTIKKAEFVGASAPVSEEKKAVENQIEQLEQPVESEQPKKGGRKGKKGEE
jgi:hypothetical protein